jgi:hypothetical protein
MYTRRIIYCSDIAQIFGITKRAAQYRAKKLREYFGKNSDQPIFVDEFCYFYGCSRDIIDQHFRGLGESEYPDNPDKDE